MTPDVMHITGLEHSYGRTQALRGVDLRVRAGKTTLVGALTGGAVGAQQRDAFAAIDLDTAAAALLAGLALGPLGAAAAVGLALLMIGAEIHHHRAHDPLSITAPVAALFVLAVSTAVARLVS